MRFILAFQKYKRQLWSKGFDMDRVEIVDPGANGEDVFLGFTRKLPLGQRKS
jgi:hypothetical protein